MKKLTLFFVLLFTSLTVLAQDVIVKKDGSTILSKVMEINGTEIKYKKWSNQDGPLYTINKTEISTINYQNGEMEVFSEETTAVNNQQTYDNSGQPHYLYGVLELDRHNGSITWNGNPVSAEDGYYLLGEKAFDEIEGGFRMYNTGKIFYTIHFTTLLAGGLFYGIGYAKDNNALKTLGYVNWGITIPCLVLAFPFQLSGLNRMDSVVEEYNRKNETYNKSTSVFLSPSLIRTEIPQSTGVGMGLTFSMSF